MEEFLKIKLEASGWPKNCQHPDYPDGTTLPDTDDEEILKIKENASTEFAIKHILPITKSVLFSNRVYISFGNKLPLYIRYNTNNASLKYFLAPIT